MHKGLEQVNLKMFSLEVFLLELSATENVPILKMNFGDRHMPVYSAANRGYWILADTAYSAANGSYWILLLADTAWAVYSAAHGGYWILADTAWATYSAASGGYWILADIAGAAYSVANGGYWILADIARAIWKSWHTVLCRRMNNIALQYKCYNLKREYCWYWIIWLKLTNCVRRY